MMQITVFMGSVIALRVRPVKRSRVARSSYVGMSENSPLFRHVWAYLETPHTRGNKAFRHLHIAACFLGHNKERRFGGQHTGTKRFQLGKAPKGEFEMPGKKTDKHSPREAANLVAQYRPLGLRAVLAAALQVKPKPVKKPALPKQFA
jgi:hypothetical protein